MPSALSQPPRLEDMQHPQSTASLSADPSAQNNESQKVDAISPAETPLRGTVEENKLPPEVTTQEVEGESVVSATPESEKLHVQNRSSDSVFPVTFWKTHWIYAMMVTTTIIGLGACGSHHGMYSSFRGRTASPDQQETFLRYGNLLATIAQLSFCASVWTVYRQVLWLDLAQSNQEERTGTVTDNEKEPASASDTNEGQKEAKRNTTTLEILDTVTSVESSMINLFQVQRFSRLKMPYLAALTAWLLHIPALLTPATLVVVPSLNVTDTRAVPVLDITNVDLNTSFAYDTPITPSDPHNATDLEYVGARSIILTIGAAAASSGRIQDIQAPIDDSIYQGYSVSWEGPYVRCQDADANQTKIINTTVNRIMAIKHDTYMEAWNIFTAFIPIFGPPTNDIDINMTTVNMPDGQTVTALWDADVQRPLNTSTNEIWMRFYRYKKDSRGQYITEGPDNQRIPPELHYLTCKLYNATYNVGFSWNDGIQTVVNKSIHLHDAVAYPNDTKGHPTDVVRHAYTAVFQVLASRIVGRMAFYNDTSGNASGNAGTVEKPLHYSSFETRIRETSLVGSDDLDYYFAINKLLFSDNLPEPFRDQRLQDKAVAKNQTLDYLVEDLMFNITVSLLHDPLLARLVNVTATHSDDRIQYDYRWRTLVSLYAAASALTLLWVGVGVWAYIRNEWAAFDLSFSTIISVSRSHRLDNLMPPCCHGVYPLPDESLKAALEVRKTSSGRRPGRNIVLVEDIKPVCEKCNPPPRRPSQAPGRSDRKTSIVETLRRVSLSPASPRGSRIHANVSPPSPPSAPRSPGYARPA